MKVTTLPTAGLSSPQPLLFGQVGYSVILLTPEGSESLPADESPVVAAFRLGMQSGMAIERDLQQMREGR